MSKIVVPEEMLKAASDAWAAGCESIEVVEGILEAGLRWLSENRQDMSPALLKAIRNDVEFLAVNETNIYEIVNAALRRMFLTPESKVPEEVSDLVDRLFSNGTGQEAERLVLTSSCGENLGGWCKRAVIDQVLEAFRRGKASR
jgi:hypothetical protein